MDPYIPQTEEWIKKQKSLEKRALRLRMKTHTVRRKHHWHKTRRQRKRRFHRKFRH